MTATLNITRDPVDQFVTVVVDCEHGTSTALAAESDAMPLSDEWLVLYALCDHVDNQDCHCTADLWRQYGQNWKRLGMPFPAWAFDTGADTERQS